MSKSKDVVITPIISIKHKELFFSDKTRSENKIFYFEIAWFILTFSTSLYKLSTIVSSPTGFGEAVYFLAVFSAPILIRHSIRYDLFNTLKNYYGTYYKVLSIIINAVFWITLLFLFFVLVNLYYLNKSGNDNLFLIAVPFHIVVLFIGMYDKIVMRMIPKLKEEEEQ